MKCVLVGNYGVGNIGDEALREYFLSAFPEISWTVVSARPETAHEVPRLPLGIRSLFAPWLRTVKAIRHADALVFGGGSLFTDIESVWACVIWRSYAALAAWYRVPVILAFQGAGPWKTALGLKLAKKTYQEAAFVSVRDAESLARLQLFGLTKPAVLTSDPAFAFFGSHPRNPIGKRLVIIPRTNSNPAFLEKVGEKLEENFTDVRILLMQPSQAERRVGERFRLLAGDKAEIVPLVSVSQFLHEVSAASEVISERYHGALAALAMGVPVEIVPQGEGDKLQALQAAVNHSQDSVQLFRDKVSVGENALKQALQGFC